MAWQPPPRFEEYELGESLGRGRSGQVYLARDNLLERTVAVKFLPFADAALPARFLIEARAAARIQHPNVATLYRIGQLPGCAFLVWELVRGRSLDQLERPAAHELVLGIARDAARGLAAAHRRGVVHRDIKLANLVLAETGEAKLVDFGLAALVTPPDGRSSPTGDVAAAASEPRLVGTPYFRAPELWRGEPADARSDLYALGLVLYELLAGDGPFRDLSIGELAEAVQHTPARPLQVAAPGVPDGLAALVDRCLHTDRDARFATADDVVAALELLARGRGRAAVPDGNPYRGLRAYEAEHRVVFFGRARPLQLAIERLRAEPMLVVIGDSGVGKSSLCSAAVLPAVSDGALEDGRRWMIARMVPGREPLRQLIGALAALTSLAAPDLGAAVARSPRDVARIARGALRAEQGWLLYVDQMEELVTHATADTHAASEVLAALADGVPGVRVLATARSDFLSRLAVLPGLVERLPPALMLLAPMTATDVREAIVGPAAICGTRFESEPLVDELVASTEGAQGSLPLLQFTLAELWERRDRAAQAISAASLASIGGVAGALANHADGVLVSLSTEERAVARAVFLRLVTVDDTRARRTDDELHALSPLAPRVVAALVRGRLLVASESPDGTVYEIAHEALVHGWGTLARWLAEDVEVRAGRHRLESAAAEWQRVGRRRDLLWSARQLDETDARAFDELAPRERAFADASRRASAIARWLRRAGVVAAALAIGGAWLGARIQQRNTTNREIAEDVALATRSSDAARAAAFAREKARLAAFTAWDHHDPEAAEKAWAEARAATDELHRAQARVATALERAQVRDPNRTDIRRRYADLLFDRALLAADEGQPDQRDELVARLALYDDDGARRARLEAASELALEVSPPEARVELARYDGSGQIAIGSGEVRSVPAGAWLVTASVPGRVTVRVSLLLARGEPRRLKLELPVRSAIPEGFIYMPPGDVLFGSSEPEPLRRWANAVAAHRVHSGGYLIAQHETTFAQWIEFLDQLSPAERERRRPRAVAMGVRGTIELVRAGDGRWQLAIQPAADMLRARWGEPLRYPSRTRRAVQDWRKMPVTGITQEDAKAYAAWLERTQRVPGARLCTEHEWERAARGTSDRRFPHGDVLDEDDANFDATYGKQPRAFGPDEVGSHPKSRSPFGIDDLAGNAWEWVVSSVVDRQMVARGGSYYFAADTARVTNREVPEPSFRGSTLGVRVCATPIEAREL